MLGKAHKILGITSGITACALLSNNDQSVVKFAFEAGVIALSTILTSQLADTDSDNSRISEKVPILKILKNKKGIFMNVLIALMFIGLYFSTRFCNVDIPLSLDTIKTIVISLLCVITFRLIVRHLFSHRYMTHTLLFSAIMIAVFVSPLAYISGDVAYIYNLMFIGFTVGYLSHLFYDCWTTSGCKLFAPFYNKKISFFKLHSGKDDNIAIFCSVVFMIMALMNYFEVFRLFFR